MKGKMNKELIDKLRSNPEAVAQMADECGISEKEVHETVNRASLADADELLRSVIESNQAATATNSIDPGLQRNTIV
jgi:hypothetical protein